MRRNPLVVVGIFLDLFRCFNTGGLRCVLSLKTASSPPHSPVFPQNFPSCRWYFLTVCQPSASLLLSGERRTGSNLHSQGIVSRFCPTKR